VDAGDVLTIVAVAGARNGTATLSGGAVVFTPLAGYAGPAFFTYTISDAAGVTSTAEVSVTVQPVVITGAAAAETLNGTANADAIFGGEGNDTLNGLAGDDRLDGQQGADRMVGGLGDDTYVADDAGDTVVEGINQGTDTVLASVSFVLAGNVERLTLTGDQAINATGNTLANVLVGNAAENLLDGLTGADTLEGGLGDDTYGVDNVGDVVVEREGEGTDTVRTTLNNYLLGANLENLTLLGTSSLTAYGNAGDNVLTGNTGGNRLDGGAGADRLVGGKGNDTYVVENVGDTVIELAGEGTDLVLAAISYVLAEQVEQLTLTGADAIDATGNELANTLTGNAAANRLDGGAGADTMTGGLGDDTYVVDDAGDRIIETSVVDSGFDTVLASVTTTLSSYVERLVLTGAAAIDGTGNSSANELIGNAGANRLNGAAGADTMTGGQGDDTYVVDNAGDVVVEAADEGFDTITGARSITLVDNVEALILTGTGGYVGTGNSLDNVLTGNSGSNTLDGGGGADRLVGGLGNDTYVIDQAGDEVVEAAGEGTDLVLSIISYALTANVERLTLTGGLAIDGVGNELANVLTGNAAANRLDGGGGADTLSGGLGDDIYVVDNIGDVVSEANNAGVDLVLSSVSFTLGNYVERLTLTGEAAINATGNTGANVLTGNGGANVLDGKTGADTLAGGQGDDTYVVDQVGDVVVEVAGEGVDTIRSAATYVLSENVENLILTGTSAINGTGNGLDNQLVGNTAANWLVGAEGQDRLDGLAGNDILVGGSGSDVFVFHAGYGRDTITDFAVGGAGRDLIELSLGDAFDTFEEILAAANQVGNSTVITIDAATTLTLQNVEMSTLSADNLLFA
jgi:Ca2+-binding RTX toxin-like protein